MRIRTAAILAALVALGLSGCGGTEPPTPQTTAHHATCGGERPARPGGGRYDCTFTDDFTRQTLDPSNWIVGTTALGGFTTGTAASAKDCYVDSPRNVSLSSGVLHLTSHVESSQFVCHSPLGNFLTSHTGANVVSRGAFAQTYGRFEFRARFPATTTPGVDSALWMYPERQVYGPWPRSGEIDVAEWFGNRYADHILPSVHYAGENSALSTGHQCVVSHADTAFHRYAVDWSATMMRFYYDGRLCFQHAWAPAAPLAAPQPFNQPFNLVMTQTGASNEPVGTTITMDVDWVRAWR